MQFAEGKLHYCLEKSLSIETSILLLKTLVLTPSIWWWWWYQNPHDRTIIRFRYNLLHIAQLFFQNQQLFNLKNINFMRIFVLFLFLYKKDFSKHTWHFRHVPWVYSHLKTLTYQGYSFWLCVSHEYILIKHILLKLLFEFYS